MSQADLNTQFDEQVLKELREDMGEAMGDFVHGFLSAMDKTRKQMRDDLAAARLDSVGQRAHSLKGTAGYLGAVELVSTLSEIQQCAKSNAGRHSVEPLLERVDSLAIAVRRYLEARSAD